MCDPLSAAAFAVGTAASVTNYASQASQANAAARENNARYRSAADAALENYRFNLGQVDQRDSQEQAAASESAVDNAIQANEARGAAAAVAAARGVSGTSVEALLHEFSAIESDNAAVIARNRAWSSTQLDDQKKSLRAEAQDAISRAAPSRVYGPSAFGLAFDIAGQGLRSYGQHLNRKPPT